MGKPLSQSINEMKTVVTRTRALIEQSVVLETPSEGPKYITREPLGVVAVLSHGTIPICVLLMHSSVFTSGKQRYNEAFRAHTTGELDILRESLIAASLPENLVAAVHTTIEDTHSLLVHPEIGYVSFTGSTAGGRHVYKTISTHPSFVDVSLELGGKDAAYVREDCDLKLTVAGVVDGAMYNAGQSCCSVERCYVHESVHDEFIQMAMELIGAYVLGDPLAQGTSIGPVAQPHHPRFLELQVKGAVEQGATLLCGGYPTSLVGKGRFFQPTLLVNCSNEMGVMRNENFGPILSVCKVSGDKEAIELINDCDYGLTASIWTKDRRACINLGKQLDVGTIYHNRCDFVDPYLAWHGRKQSGKGFSLSKGVFMNVTKPKSLLMA